MLEALNQDVFTTKVGQAIFEQSPKDGAIAVHDDDVDKQSSMEFNRVVRFSYVDDPEFIV